MLALEVPDEVLAERICGRWVRVRVRDRVSVRVRVRVRVTVRVRVRVIGTPYP